MILAGLSRVNPDFSPAICCNNGYARVDRVALARSPQRRVYYDDVALTQGWTDNRLPPFASHLQAIFDFSSIAKSST
jgi:hypothetical protein